MKSNRSRREANTMTDKHFNAILAKNDIAREIASGEPNFDYILACLRQIESYIGEANQPDVNEIMEVNTDPNIEFLV